MSLVAVFMSGLAMFSDLGIGPSIISSARSDDPKFLNSAWTLQIIRGFSLALATCVFAYPYSVFYEQPVLFGLLIATAINPVVNGFNSTKLATAGRSMSLGRITLIELASQVFSAIVTITWVYNSRDIWGMIAGGISGGVMKATCTHVFLSGIPNRLCWDTPSFRELLHFGRWIFFSTLLTYSASQADRLIFGKQLPLDMFGIYANALIISGLPVQVFMRLSTSVLFPLYRRVLDQGRSLGSVFERVRLPFLIVGAMAVSWLLAVGPNIVSLLYDIRYADAGWMVQILSVGVWFQFLGATTGAVLLATGNPQVIVLGNIGKLTVFITTVIASLSFGDMQYALWAVVASEFAKYFVLAAGVSSNAVPVIRNDMKLSMYFAFTSLAGLTLAKILNNANCNNSLLIFSVGSMIVVLWAPIAVVFAHVIGFKLRQFIPFS